MLKQFAILTAAVWLALCLFFVSVYVFSRVQPSIIEPELKPEPSKPAPPKVEEPIPVPDIDETQETSFFGGTTRTLKMKINDTTNLILDKFSDTTLLHLHLDSERSKGRQFSLQNKLELFIDNAKFEIKGDIYNSYVRPETINEQIGFELTKDHLLFLSKGKEVQLKVGTKAIKLTDEQSKAVIGFAGNSL